MDQRLEIIAPAEFALSEMFRVIDEHVAPASREIVKRQARVLAASIYEECDHMVRQDYSGYYYNRLDRLMLKSGTGFWATIGWLFSGEKVREVVLDEMACLLK